MQLILDTDKREGKMRKIIVSIGIVLFFTGCGNTNPNEVSQGVGFFSGIWDGWTVFFAFVGKMFGANYNIYEVNNNGNFYNFGFLLGMSSWGVFFVEK